MFYDASAKQAVAQKVFWEWTGSKATSYRCHAAYSSFNATLIDIILYQTFVVRHSLNKSALIIQSVYCCPSKVSDIVIIWYWNYLYVVVLVSVMCCIDSDEFSPPTTQMSGCDYGCG